MKHSASSLSLTGISLTRLAVVLLVVAAVGSGCAGVKPTTEGGMGGKGVSGSGGIGVPPMRCTGPNGLCTDFPDKPVVDNGAPTTTCASPGSGAGPCIMEPEDGTLFPSNWLRPRISVKGSAGPFKITFHSDKEVNDMVVYTADPNWKMPKEIWTNLTSHVQSSPITVNVCAAGGGTSTTHFTIAPASAAGTMVYWAANPVAVNVDPHSCQPPNGSVSNCVGIAELRGFAVGDETTENVLGINQVQQLSRRDDGNTTAVTCIGCHSATPDKSFVSFGDAYPWRTAIASVAGTTATPPSGSAWTTTPSGLAALQLPGWGPFTFNLSKADTVVNPYWKAGTRIGVGGLGISDPTMAIYDNQPDRNDSPHLAWFNLEAPNPGTGNNSNWAYPSFSAGNPYSGIDSGNSLGYIQHTGDNCGAAPCGAGMPSWSHDGSKILYVSTNAMISGRFNIEAASPINQASQTDMYHLATAANFNASRMPGMTNLFTVPFNNGMGGGATPVNGAATTEREEFYPAYSPDDRFIAYTAVPAGEVMYANPHEEIYAVASTGGTASRLKANDPPSCSGKSSPGVNNHWPKWSPDVANGPNGSKYYWLIFSSNRADLPPVLAPAVGNNPAKLVTISQLYLAPVVVTETGDVGSFPAIYLWNQRTDQVNTTPAWESFVIPIIP